MANILIVEDEKRLAAFLLRGLTAEGYGCHAVTTIEQLYDHLETQSTDLIILDRMLGSIDSIEVIPALNNRYPNTKILMLTALDAIDDRVAGLRQGADDYLGKPFDFEELLARTESLLRRQNVIKSSEKILEKGRLTLYPDNKKALVGQTEIALTKLEFELLTFFMINPDKVLSRERILNRVWSIQNETMTNVVDVYIRRLRKKIDESLNQAGTIGDANDFIETVRGSGYRLGNCGMS